MQSYVTHIESTPLKHLVHLHPSPDGLTAYMDSTVMWTPVCTVGLSALEVTDEVSDGTRLVTTKITYTTSHRPAAVREPLAYRLTLTNGEQLIVGLPYKPYPLGTISEQHEDKASGRASVAVTVELKNAPFGPLKVVS